MVEQHTVNVPAVGSSPTSTATCCLCGQGEEDGATVAHCPECKHDFCDTCNALYFDRGIAWFKQFLFRKPPRHCKGH